MSSGHHLAIFPEGCVFRFTLYLWSLSSSSKQASVNITPLRLQTGCSPKRNYSPAYSTLHTSLLPSVLISSLGGLAAVIYTDALQTLIMLIGALVLMGYSKWGPRVIWVDDSTSLKKGHLLSSLFQTQLGIPAWSLGYFSWKRTVLLMET